MTPEREKEIRNAIKKIKNFESSVHIKAKITLRHETAEELFAEIDRLRNNISLTISEQAGDIALYKRQVDELLEEIDRLQGELNKSRGLWRISGWKPGMDELIRECDELREKLALAEKKTERGDLWNSYVNVQSERDEYKRQAKVFSKARDKWMQSADELKEKLDVALRALECPLSKSQEIALSKIRGEKC